MDCTPQAADELHALEKEVMETLINSLSEDYFNELADLFAEQGLEVPETKEGKIRLLAERCQRNLPEHPDHLTGETDILLLEVINGLDRDNITGL